jgi:hypothetical protein
MARTRRRQYWEATDEAGGRPTVNTKPVRIGFGDDAQDAIYTRPLRPFLAAHHARSDVCNQG